MSRPKFNKQQQTWIKEALELWFKSWKGRIVRDPRQPHNLSQAKSDLEKILAD
jgi:hypothetical protein